MLDENQIQQYFKANVIRANGCNCIEQIINLRWADTQRNEHVYGTDVLIKWSKDVTYRTARAGGKSAPLSQFRTCKELASWIDKNHTMPKQ